MGADLRADSVGRGFKVVGGAVSRRNRAAGSVVAQDGESVQRIAEGYRLHVREDSRTVVCSACGPIENKRREMAVRGAGIQE